MIYKNDDRKEESEYNEVFIACEKFIITFPI